MRHVHFCTEKLIVKCTPHRSEKGERSTNFTMGMRFSRAITAESPQCRMNHPRAQTVHPRCADTSRLQAQLGYTLLSPQVISSVTPCSRYPKRPAPKARRKYYCPAHATAESNKEKYKFEKPLGRIPDSPANPKTRFYNPKKHFFK